MRAHRWRFAAALIATAIGLGGCSYAPEFAATTDEAGHVQIEWCFGGDLVVTANDGDSVLRVDSTPPSSRQRVDLSVTSSAQWSPSAPELQPDTELEVWEASTFDSEGGVPELTFRVSDLQPDRYLHHGNLISPRAWIDECNPDDGPPVSRSVLIAFALLSLICVGSVIALIVWGIASVSRTRSNGGMPKQPR